MGLLLETLLPPAAGWFPVLNRLHPPLAAAVRTLEEDGLNAVL